MQALRPSLCSDLAMTDTLFSQTASCVVCVLAHVSTTAKGCTAVRPGLTAQRMRCPASMHMGASMPARWSRSLTRLQAAGDAAVREIMPSATIFKPGPLVGNEDRLTNNIAQLGKKYPLLPLVGNGTARLQPVYVRDVADALMASLRSRDSMGKDYYLAGPDVLTRAPGPRLSGAAGARQLCHDAAAGIPV